MTATVQATAKKSRAAVKTPQVAAPAEAQDTQAAQVAGRKAAKKVAVKEASVKKVTAKKVTAKKAAAAQPAVPALDLARNPTDKGRRLAVRQSGVHGKGVFAVKPLKKGELVVEYVGEVITWAEALRRHPHDPSQPDHTFYFHIDDETVIDGKVGGNASRWINHSCAPNLEADDESGRVFLRALRRIPAGEELSFDYGLVIDERYTPALKKRFECRCGAATCRGTMLAPKRGSKVPQATA